MNPADLPAEGTVRSEAVTPRTWRYAAIAAAVALGALVTCYWNTAVSLVETWAHSSTYTQGFIVFPVSAWLMWQRRRQLATITPRPCVPALVVLAALSVLWLVGYLGNVQTFQQFALVASVPMLLWGVLGTSFATTVAFALLFMVFAWPFGEFLIPPLIDRTADFCVTALRLTGIPVFRQGNEFTVPTGSWSVVEACSGVRYLIAALCAGSLFAYFTYRSLRRRLIFLGACIVVPIVANWVRAYLTVLLGHLTNNKLAAGVDHLIYGWIFFGVVMSILFYVGTRWRETDASDNPDALPNQPSQASPRAATFAAVCAAAIALAAIGPTLAWALEHRGTTEARDIRLAVPVAAGPWQPTPGWPTNWESPF